MKQRHWNAQLTESDVENIRKLSDSGMTDREIAAKFEISRMHAYRITKYRARVGSYL